MQRPLKWSGLQARMTISYVWVTVASVLLIEVAVFLIAVMAATTTYENRIFTPRVMQTAKQYAQTISSQTKGGILSLHATYVLGNPHAESLSGELSPKDGLIVPAISQLYPADKAIAFALLIAPNGQIIASSYPKRYTIGTAASQLLPHSLQLINNTLRGRPTTNQMDMTLSGSVMSTTETIWSNKHTPIGAIYLQVPMPNIEQLILLPIAASLVGSGIVLLIITTPIGTLFGIITTRGLVSRIHNLVTATTSFANGNSSQRVRVTRKDEVGQLEQQFNRMAEQLVESTTKRQELAEQNARLAERSRISRELHDAISQDLFSLSMLAGGLQAALPSDSPLRPQVSILEQTTTNMIREMRALLLELRPTTLGQLGLAETLEEIATAYSTRLGISVTTNICDIPHLNAKAEHALLRITQEAITNAVRHSHASTLTISLTPQEDQVELVVADSGKGFNPNEHATSFGLGLRLMQERVQELNGTFVLQSADGQGTRIQVCLPRG